MEDLLPHFERELVILRRYCKEFAERFPKIAGKLHLGGDANEDPHVERLIQAVAFLAARISKRLDDDYPQFTEALLETLFPHYLRPFPSCAIVRVDHSGVKYAGMSSMSTIPRGTEMDSHLIQGVRCKFKSVYELVGGPVVLSAARFDPLIKAPSSVKLPANVNSSLSIEIDSGSDKVDLSALGINSLRIFIDGEPSFCAALRDTLFMRTVCAYVELDDGHWATLPALPLTPVGFAEQDALIPFGARSHPACRLLNEYFAFPEKFNFFDIDLAAIRARAPGKHRRYILHLAVAGLRSESSIARMLRSLSSDNLLLGCSPVVNLFQRPGEPIAITQQAADYSVLAHQTNPQAFEVYSIDSVHMLRQRENDSAAIEFRPFYSLRHGEGASRKGRYWVARHDTMLAATSPGHEKKISLVDADFEPLAVDKSTLSIMLSCTNRDLPSMLKYGQASGDLQPSKSSDGAPIRLLRRPSPAYRFTADFGLHWRLISHLTLNHHSLTQEGLPALREMLTLHNLPQSPVSQRQIGGIVGLEHAETVNWMRYKGRAALVHGLEVRITLDEEAFVGSGMHLFTQVLDQFFGLYVQINSFIELVVLSNQSGEELIRCPARSGSANLV